MKYRSCWHSLHDPQVNVTRSTDIWIPSCRSCFHNRKVEKHFYRCPRFWPLAPPKGMDPGVRSHGMKADPPGYRWSKYECFLMIGYRDDFLKKLAYKTLMQCDGDGTRMTGVTTIALLVLHTGNLKMLDLTLSLFLFWKRILVTKPFFTYKLMLRYLWLFNFGLLLNLFDVTASVR